MATQKETRHWQITQQANNRIIMRQEKEKKESPKENKTKHPNHLNTHIDLDRLLRSRMMMNGSLARLAWPFMAAPFERPRAPKLIFSFDSILLSRAPPSNQDGRGAKGGGWDLFLRRPWLHAARNQTEGEEEWEPPFGTASLHFSFLEKSHVSRVNFFAFFWFIRRKCPVDAHWPSRVSLISWSLFE